MATTFVNHESSQSAEQNITWKVPAQRTQIGAAPIDAVSFEIASSWLLRALQARHLQPSQAPLQIMGPNAYLVTLAGKNRHFAKALQCASLCLPDGMSVVWAARFLGIPMPERVPGGEFMERMASLCAEHGLSLYLLGGLPGAAEGAARTLVARHPGLQIAGTDCPPLNFEQDEALNEAVLARIAAVKPDLLCVALGAPKQEIWMWDEVPSLPIGAALSVGAALDTLAGLRKRAPAWTHNIGAEWLYRLIMEPRRLWKRYLIGNLEFALIATREWGQRRKDYALAEMLRNQAAAVPPVGRVSSETGFDSEVYALLHPEGHMTEEARSDQEN